MRVIEFLFMCVDMGIHVMLKRGIVCFELKGSHVGEHSSLRGQWSV